MLTGAQINREALPDGFPAKNYGNTRKIIRAARPESHYLWEGDSEQKADLAPGLFHYGADYG